ncbi:MAG: LuxR C-terminal-related transcriptional regulator [Pseudoruegeria sp.]
MDDALDVILSNEGAAEFFGLRKGRPLDQADLPRDTARSFHAALTKAFSGPQGGQYLVKAQIDHDGSPLVLHIRRLPATSTTGRALSLVVTRSYRWNTALGPTLGEVFGLTIAEQGVVRSLVEGRNVKEIAGIRGTSEGTVRGQLKSILSKMNARSQSEIIRLVVNLQAVSQKENPSAPSDGAPVGADWIDAEVWKPFKTVRLPDGRRMDYHEMGPANGVPILYSHMGYCIARWHAPMVKLPFLQGLRVICSIRAGNDQSDNIDPKADVLSTTREDTLFPMDHFGLRRVPYVVQGRSCLCHRPCRQASRTGQRDYRPWRAPLLEWRFALCRDEQMAPLFHLNGAAIPALVTLYRAGQCFAHAADRDRGDVPQCAQGLQSGYRDRMRSVTGRHFGSNC